ncbi:polysaccharide lyase 8 family protein [Rathayibacter sp. SD072]|uniref:polysaccharide lyase 8 family protein n=1 Tax=Rathayibacter sp. SD072 TaxID=2781731 RepID=UPI001A95FAE8|nr:polysaccharide lyase 8 family protein [Rathayibacter sp. SD072]MBO0984386.1 polysaccharide lyase 8 family protein [Rathayibacter sp. SD072]
MSARTPLHPVRSLARRAVAAVLAGLLVLALAPTTAAAAPAPAASAPVVDLDAMRERIVAGLVGTVPGSDAVGDLSAAAERVAEQARSYRAALDPAGTEPWADLSTGESMIEVWRAYQRLVVLARAVKTPGSSLFEDRALIRDVVATADRLHATRYNEGTVADSHWWQAEIGVPRELNHLVALLHDDLSDEQERAYLGAAAHFSDSVQRTGANRVWSASVLALRSVLLGQPDRIGEAVEAVAPALRTAAGGDGFHADGSFVQHGVFAYTGGYGLSMLETLAELHSVLDGSPFSIRGPDGSTIHDRVLDAFGPVTWCGALMSTVRGREIARADQEDTEAGVRVQAAVLRLADSAGPALQSRLRALAKSWLECAGDRAATVESQGGVADVVRARLVLQDAAIEPAPIGSGAVSFTGMDRFVRSTDDWAFAVGMSSERIAGFETLSGENGTGWSTGNGATYLYSGAAEQYDGGYWATADPYRVPGTTEDTIVRAPGDGGNETVPGSAAGSIATPSEAGVAAFVHRDPATGLVAQKAWFAFDDEIVALGSGITSTGMTGPGWDGAPRRVETTVDSRRALGEDAVLRVDGAPVAAGSSSTTTARWASITGSGESVGYVFPEPASVTALDETRSGEWSGEDRSPAAARFDTLTLDHGTDPTDAGYAWTVLPGSDEAATAAYALDPDVDVLASTAQLGAVRDGSSGTVSAVTWSDEPQRIVADGRTWGEIDGRALVSVHEDERTVTVTVSDPAQLGGGAAGLTAPVTVDLARDTFGTVGGADAAVSVSASPGHTVVTVAPSGERGATASVTFEKEPRSLAELPVIVLLVLAMLALQLLLVERPGSARRRERPGSARRRGRHAG